MIITNTYIYSEINKIKQTYTDKNTKIIFIKSNIRSLNNPTTSKRPLKA